MSTSPTPPRQWGISPTPPEPQRKRSGRILLALAVGVALLVATGVVANGSTLDPGPLPTPPVEDPAGNTELSETEPEPRKAPVPDLAGMTRAAAKQTLTDHGLKATTKYRSTGQYPAGTVISQSPKAGTDVPPDTTIRLVVAKTPPPRPSTAPPPTATPEQNCDPSYPDVCLDPAVEDYDCASGSGDGPEYVEGPIRVRPPDRFDLDREGDGVGCENG